MKKDQILPHDLDVERLVLGTLMTERNALSEVREILNEDCFYDNFHRDIFKSILSIADRGERPDLVSVANELRKTSTEVDMYRLSCVSENITFDIYQHAALLHDKEKRRRFWEIGQYLTQNAFSETEDIVDVLAGANDMLAGVLSSSVSSVSTMPDAIKGVYNQIEKNCLNTAELTGTPTGLYEYDKKSGGLQRSDLIIIAAETSQGKTSLALTISMNAALKGARLAIYSMEMKKEQLAARMMAMQSGIPANEILYSRMMPWQFEKLDKSIASIYDVGILFDDRSTSNIDIIIASIRSMVTKYKIEGAVIDYLQILNVNMKGTNKEQQMGEVARRLKNLAKELDIWIIALSQLNRDAVNPVPNLNRLRDSGQIAEAADVVLLIYRPEYYNKAYPEPFQDKITDGTALLDVAKGRNTGLLKFICYFDKRTTLFSDEPVTYDNGSVKNSSDKVPF